MKLMVPTSKTVKIYTHSFCFFVFVWGGILTNRILQNIKEGNSSVICFGRVGVDFCSCFSSLEVGVVWEGVDVFLHHLVAEFVLFLWGLGHSRVRQENPHLTQHLVSRAGPPSLWPQEKKLCFPSPSEVLLESQKTFLLKPWANPSCPTSCAGFHSHSRTLSQSFSPFMYGLWLRMSPRRFLHLLSVL